MAHAPRDPRLDPQPGDTLTVSADTTSARTYTVVDGRYAAMWADGHVFPAGGLGATMVAYERARRAVGGARGPA